MPRRNHGCAAKRLSHLLHVHTTAGIHQKDQRIVIQRFSHQSQEQIWRHQIWTTSIKFRVKPTTRNYGLNYGYDDILVANPTIWSSQVLHCKNSHKKPSSHWVKLVKLVGCTHGRLPHGVGISEAAEHGRHVLRSDGDSDVPILS